METQCRAKDPSTCRTHGSNNSGRWSIAMIKDNSRLATIAEDAKASGDFEIFIQAKAQIDKNVRESAFSAPSEKTGISEEAGTAAAEARWSAEAGGLAGHQWKDASAGTKSIRITQEKAALAEALTHMPHGKITDEAVEAMAIYRQTSYGGNSWSRLGGRLQEEHREYSRASLEAAAPHLGISLNTKASIRNLFRNMGNSFAETKENVEGTVVAGIEEISEHHAKEIPAEVGGSTVAWSDLNPFKNPFKNGKLR